VTRRRLVALVSAFALLGLAAVAALVVVLVTQTSYGQEQVRRFIAERLATKVQGKLYVGHIHGGLLTGVTVDSIEIRGKDDSLFVATGPITVEYDPRDLVDKRILLSHLQVEHPVVHLRRYETGDWNWRRIFPEGPKGQPSAERGFGDYIVMDSATIHDGAFYLTMPWHPDDTLRGAKRDSAITFNLDRDDKEILRAGRGFTRTWRWTRIDAESPYVRIADKDSVGKYFGISQLAVAESDPPFRFRNVRGGVKVNGDSVWIDVPHFDLPRSTGSARGKVVWGSDLPIRYAIHVAGDSVALADVGWVYPTLPHEGGGSMQLDIRNDPRNLTVLDYAISDMDVRTTKSRLRGRMTYGVGGPVLVVKDVDLEAAPVDFDLLRTLNGKPFPYDWQGQLVGTVKGPGGPLTHFRVSDAQVSFRDAHVPGAVSRAAGRGELDILYPAFTTFHGFDVDVATLDLRTIEYLNPNFPRLGGTVDGRVTLDSVWTDVRFRDADVRHRDGPGEPSHAMGSGRVTWGEKFMTYDVDLQLAPVSFTTLARSYPRLPVRGSYQGPLRAQGTVEDLAVATTLTGPAGTLAYDGRVDVYPATYGLRGHGSVKDLDLRTLLDRPSAPATTLTGAFDASVSGDSAAGLAGLAGALALDVERSRVAGTVVYPSRARLRFVDGVLRVDTLAVETAVAKVGASGGIGLAAGRADSLAYEVLVDSLGGLRRWLTPARRQTGARRRAPRTTESARALALRDSLGGSLAVTGVVSGTLDTLGAGVSVAGEVGGLHLFVRGDSAHGLHAEFALRDVLRAPTGRVSLALDTLAVGGVQLDSARVAVRLPERGHALFTAAATSASGPVASAGGDVRAAADTTRIRLDSLRLVLPREVAQGGRDTTPAVWRLARPARITFTPAGTTIDSLVLRDAGAGRLALSGDVPNTLPVRLTVTGDSVALADVGELLQSRVPLRGTLGFAGRVEGTRERPVMRFDAALGEAAFGDLRLERLTARGGYRDQRLDAGLQLFRGGQPVIAATASLPVDLALVPTDGRLLDDSLRGTVRADSVSLALLETFTPALSRTAGFLTANVAVGGTWDAPRYSGHLRAGGAFDVTRLGVRYDRVHADLALDGDSVTIRRLSAHSGEQPGDTVSLTGYVSLADAQNWRVGLRLYARRFHAVASRRIANLYVSARPGVELVGAERGSVLSGGARVDRGEIYIPELAAKKVLDLNDPELMEVVDTTVFAKRALPPWLDTLLANIAVPAPLRIEIGDDVWLRSAEANIQLGGYVNVTRGRGERAGEERLALDGVLTANRGTYRLNLGPVQRTFIVESGGSIRFLGQPDLNPELDISALYTVRQYNKQDIRVRVRITGTLNRPQLTLSSADNLQLSQSDLVSYLVTGQPSFDVSGQQTETVASVLVPTLGSAFEQLLARQFPRVDVFRVETGGFGSATTPTTGVNTALTEGGRNAFYNSRLGIGTQLSDRTYLTASAGLCPLLNRQLSGSTSDIREYLSVKIEHRLNYGFSLETGVEPGSTALLCGSASTTPRGVVVTPRQFGFDLFRSWQF
jgi:translocation and assembly module TamB